MLLALIQSHFTCADELYMQDVNPSADCMQQENRSESHLTKARRGKLMKEFEII